MQASGTSLHATGLHGIYDILGLANTADTYMLYMLLVPDSRCFQLGIQYNKYCRSWAVDD